MNTYGDQRLDRKAFISVVLSDQILPVSRVPNDRMDVFRSEEFLEMGSDTCENSFGRPVLVARATQRVAAIVR